MAIYVPDVADYIPQIQPYQPNFNFYAGALQMKQDQYDTNYKKLSSVYGTLLNSPMLRDGNIARRDQFFKDADTQIKKIAGLDLSRAENVDSAMAIFKPFYEDKAIIKDMTWTKQYQNEMTRAENFRNCVDPKKCGGQYWDGGVKALNYKAQDFRDATDDEALVFDSPKFTPFINITAEAAQATKDAGFNIQVDTLKGGYIVTTKNGQLLEQPLHDYFMGLFGSDPAVVEMFKTQAYIQRKDFAYANAASFGGSTEKAEQAYVNQVMSTIVPAQKQAAANASDLVDGLSAKKAAMDNNISQNGMILNTPVHRAYSDLLAQIDTAQSTSDVYKTSNDLADTANNLNSISAMRDRVDDIVTYGLLNGQMDTLAKTMAYKDYSVSLKEDPYALAAYNSKLSLQNALTLKAADFETWKQKQAYKDELTNTQQLGTAEENSLTPDPSAKGTSAEDNAPLAKQANADKLTELNTAQGGDEKTYLKKLANTLAAEYAAAPGHKSDGQDDGGTRQAMLKQTAMKAFSGTGLDYRKVLSGTEDLSKIDKISNDVSSSAYQRAVEISNPDTPVTGTVNSFWNESFWTSTADIRDGVKNRASILSDFTKYYKEQNDKVIQTMLADPDVEEDRQSVGEPYSKAYAIKNLTTPEGRVKSKEQFAADYAKANSFYFDRTYFLGITTGAATKEEQYKAALAQGESLYDDAYELYNDTYLHVGKAYNAPPNMNGPAGGAVSGGAVKGTVDANNTKARNTLYAADIFRNINSLDMSGNTGVYVRYGDADEKKGSDGANLLLKQLMSDFNTQSVKGRKKPVFDMRYQTIAANDANYSAVTFFPSEEWAKKYKGSKASPGLAYDGNYRNGITVLIPKDQENNSLAEHSKYSDYQFVMEHTGKLELKDYPNAGEVTLQKSGANYRAFGYINKYDEQGNMYRDPVEQLYPMDLDPGTVYTNWQSQLKYYSDFNKSIGTAISQQYGVKDPAKLQAPQQPQ